MRQRLTYLAMFVIAGLPAFGSLVNLNTGSPFGLLGGTIATSGILMVNGNVQAMNTMTASPGLTATGNIYSPGDSSAAMQAYNEFKDAFSTADLLASTASFAGLNSNQTFTANSVNTFTESDVSTGSGVNLTFNAEGNSNAVFVIKTTGALNVNGGLTFTLENGAQASNIYWIVGTAATIMGGNSGPMVFDGNVLAGNSFTLASGGSFATINGCVFAENSNTISGETTINGCNFDDPVGAPEPSTAGMVGLGFLVWLLAWRKLRS